MATPAIESVSLAKVAKEFDGTWALRGVTLAIGRGDRIALLGHNGAGKSTLLGVLAGLVRPSHGDVLWRRGGQEIDQDQARGAVGLLSHETFLYGDLSASENLRFWARLHGRADGAGEAARWLDRVGIPARAVDRPVRTYSRGMRQRVGIARAFLSEPDLLLLDEPFTGLDRDGAALLSGLLSEPDPRRRAIVLCSHDLERAAPLCARVVVLRDGMVESDDRREKFAARIGG